MRISVLSWTFKTFFVFFYFIELGTLYGHVTGEGFVRVRDDSGLIFDNTIKSDVYYQNFIPSYYNESKLPDDEIFSYDSSIRDGRIFNPLNPFDLFGNPLCQHERLDGKCYELVRCAALAGRVGPLCRGFRGICCRFTRNCGQRSSQEIVYWSNYNRDEEDKEKKKKNKKKYNKNKNRNPRRNWADHGSSCEFNIIRRTRNYCGLKIMPFIHPKNETTEPVETDSQENSQKIQSSEPCVDTKLAIVGLGDRLELNLCSARDSADIKEYTIGMKNVSELKITLENRARAVNPVDVKVIQLKCTEYTGEDLSGTSTGSAGFGTTEATETATTTTESSTAESVTTGNATTDGTTTEAEGGSGAKPPAPPTTTTTTTKRPTTLPLPDYSQCGIKGPERIGKNKILEIFENLRKAVEDTATVEDDASEIYPQGPPTTNMSRGTKGRQDETADPEWAVPTLDDTVFSHFMGPTPLITNTRITGGKVTKPFEYPWQCALFSSSGKFSCGCSVIGNRFILTAAHCVNTQKNNPGAIMMHVGDWDLHDNRETRHQRVHASSIRVHPGYSSRNLQNDIAIVKVHEFIEYHRGVRPICLPKKGLDVEGKLATVTGWGRDRNKKLQGKLKELTASVISNRVCGERWNAHPFIVSTMLCMDTHIGDSCNGDSGGPSVIQMGDRYVQVGIVSFGSGSCTDSQLPGVYTRVSEYANWIFQNMF